jgi:hypothetical protein
MSVNGDHPTVEDELPLEDPSLEPDVLDCTPSSQQSAVQHYAFLKKLRVLHYLGNLHATRVVPAFEEWQKLRTAANDWIKAENVRREDRRAAIEAEIRDLRDRRDELQQERETAEIAYAQAHSQSQEKVKLAPLPTIGGSSHETADRNTKWTGHLIALGAKASRYLGPPAAVVCGAVLGLCFGTLFGIISLDALQKGEGWHFAAAAAAVGMMIVFLLGKGMDFAVRMYADRVIPDGGGPSPFKLACAGMVLFVAAEVALEGYGIREVHHNYLVSLQRVGDGTENVALLWPPVYFLLGVLVSGPYLWCKLGAAWYRPRSGPAGGDAQDTRDGSLPIEGSADTTRRLITSGIQCRQLRERCEDVERRIGRLKEEQKGLEPVDAPMGALLEQARAAELAYRAERDRYDKLLESLIFLRAPRTESRPEPLED